MLKKMIAALFFLSFSMQVMAVSDPVELYQKIEDKAGNKNYVEMLEPLSNLIGTDVNIQNRRQFEKSVVELTGLKMDTTDAYPLVPNIEPTSFYGFRHNSPFQKAGYNFFVDFVVVKDKIEKVMIRVIVSASDTELFEKEHLDFLEAKLMSDNWTKTNYIGSLFNDDYTYEKGQTAIRSWNAVGYPMVVDIKRLDRVAERKTFDQVIISNDKAIADRIYELKRASFQ
jgi:hypothetical protein